MIAETSSVGGIRTYTYDYENRLTGVTLPDSRHISYTYSGDGRRISADNNGAVVKYIYDGMLSVAERDATGATIAAYTRIPEAPGGIGGLVSSSNGTNTIYYHCLHLGNVSQITDATGAVIQTYDYDAFGNITAENGSLVTPVGLNNQSVKIRPASCLLLVVALLQDTA